MRRYLTLVVATGCALLAASPAWAHSRPATTDPAPNGRLDVAPAHVGITYDSPIQPEASSITLLDATGNSVAVTPDVTASPVRASISPQTDLTPGPYTVVWLSRAADDGHDALGFYTFVVNGGPIGIINGLAQAQAPAADVLATLTVTAAGDGSSLLRVDLDNPAGVERVRIRLSRPDLGEDLLDTQPSGDGGWVLGGNEVAVPGAWHAVVVVRRTNIFEDAQTGFDFTVDPATGAPAFS